ncbi:hypothetical protein KDK77_00780 [bacterium]|nr:hypothetical protein [bacterium]
MTRYKIIDMESTTARYEYAGDRVVAQYIHGSQSAGSLCASLRAVF